jgi:3-methyladenine DNA glycosylase Mpg
MLASGIALTESKIFILTSGVACFSVLEGQHITIDNDKAKVWRFAFRVFAALKGRYIIKDLLKY